MGRLKVYCAGPLFNQKEQEEMLAIAKALEAAGHATFLPQRDGLELTKCVERLIGLGMDAQEAQLLMAEAIFSLDVYEVLHDCDLLVANLNGRVPDEGAVSEAAIAWSRGKPVVGYKADSRTAFGGQDNPLVTGLFRFRLAKSIEEVLAGVGEEAARLRTADVPGDREQEIEESLRLGKEISEILGTTRQVDAVVDTIRRFHSVDSATC
jgi:nucleoside 2-deoxyribosyltransferase